MYQSCTDRSYKSIQIKKEIDLINICIKNGCDYHVDAVKSKGPTTNPAVRMTNVLLES